MTIAGRCPTPRNGSSAGPGWLLLGCQRQPAAVTDASLGFTVSGPAQSRVTSQNGDLAVTLYGMEDSHLAGLLPTLKDRLGYLAILGEQRQLHCLTLHLLIRGGTDAE